MRSFSGHAIRGRDGLTGCLKVNRVSDQVVRHLGSRRGHLIEKGTRHKDRRFRHPKLHRRTALLIQLGQQGRVSFWDKILVEALAKFRDHRVLLP